MENVYKFVNWDVPPLEKLSSSLVYQLMLKLNNGGTLTRAEKNADIFRELPHPETYRTGVYKLNGYAFNFAPYMKRFLVKYKYYGWVEIVAFDKTSIRHNSATPSYILEIRDA